MKKLKLSKETIKALSPRNTVARQEGGSCCPRCKPTCGC